MRIFHEVSEVTGVVEISLSGQIFDNDKHKALLETVKKYQNDGRQNFILDLGELNSLDQTGIKLLILVKNLVREIGGSQLVLIRADKFRSTFDQFDATKSFVFANEANTATEFLLSKHLIPH